MVKKSSKIKKRFEISVGIILVITIVIVAAYLIIDSQQMYHYNGAIAPCLHEITYKDYKADEELQTIEGIENTGGSVARNGNYVGVNFDAVYKNTPFYIVHVQHNDNHLSSVGLSSCQSFTEDNMKAGKYKEKLAYLPNSTFSGINENGVFCASSTVSNKDVSPTTGTNPNSQEQIHIAFVVRYILDRADSAANAISLMKNVNIYGDQNFSLHFMICDSQKTFIVEIINNALSVSECKEDTQIMTNFYSNKENVTENAKGLERYTTLEDNYNNSNSFEGMLELMQKVKYSNVYNAESIYSVASDFMTQSEIKRPAKLIQLNATYKQMSNQYNNILLDKNIALAQEKNYWITNTTSVFDIENTSFTCYINESYESSYSFKI